MSDIDGEQPQRGLISHVANGAVGVVTCHDESRHGLSNGDVVTFEEVEGMTQLNGITPQTVRVITPYSFSIGDTSAYGTYTGTKGYFQQVKQPKTLKFKPLSQVIKKPEVRADVHLWRWGRACSVSRMKWRSHVHTTVHEPRVYCVVLMSVHHVLSRSSLISSVRVALSTVSTTLSPPSKNNMDVCPTHMSNPKLQLLSNSLHHSVQRWNIRRRSMRSGHSMWRVALQHISMRWQRLEEVLWDRKCSRHPRER